MSSTSSSNDQTSTDSSGSSRKDSPPSASKTMLADMQHNNADNARDTMPADVAEVRPSTSSGEPAVAQCGCNDLKVTCPHVPVPAEPGCLKNVLHLQRIKSQDLNQADRSCTSVAEHLSKSQAYGEEGSLESDPVHRCHVETATIGNNCGVSAADSVGKMEIEEDSLDAELLFAKNKLTACALCGCENPSCRRELKPGLRERMRLAGGCTGMKSSVIMAAITSDLDLMRKAIAELKAQEEKKHLNMVDYALLLAINRHDSDLVDCLLSLDLSRFQPSTHMCSTYNVWYPMTLMAIDLNNETMVDILLKHKASFQDSSSLGNALHCAARVGNVDIMKKLIAVGGSHLDLNATNKGVEATPLHIAVQHGNWDCARLLIEQGCKVDETEYSRGRNALHYVAAKGNLELVNLLLQKGADPGFCDADQYIPWMLAAVNNHTEVMERLLEHGAIDRPLDHNMTVLQISARAGNLKCVRLLLSMGANINSVDGLGNTALYYAAAQRHAHVCRFLCRQKDCQINVKNKSGETALHAALDNTMDGSSRLVLEALKAAGADLDIQDASDFTPLMTYIYSQEMSRWLLGAGADPNIVTAGGHTVFFEAIKVGISENSQKILWMLLRANTDISITQHVVQETQTTPLQYALKQRADKMASFLLNVGCSLRGMSQWLRTSEAEDLRSTAAMARVLARVQRKVDMLPQSLQVLSRTAVLATLGHEELHGKIAQLDVPDLLKQYLKWESFAEWTRFDDSRLLGDDSKHCQPSEEPGN